ncbi:MAG: HNH endonuclease [Hyphomicrobiales bacterium]|nr:MAG: HNH endonuclease [Hyphomicrobiales bacterium]
MQELTAELLKSVVHYEPETGVFTWIMRSGVSAGILRWNGRWPGKRAGSLNPRGYRAISLCGFKDLEHRLAWLYVTGRMPADQIDHINGQKDDNRFANLREASNSENQINKPIYATNKSGFKGVSWHRGAQKWQAFFGPKYLGLFTDIEDAAAAYSAAASSSQFVRIT